MTLEEAIIHCHEKAEALKVEVDYIPECDVPDCLECAREHEQLAEWLEDYKRLLEEKTVRSKFYD